MFEDVYLVNVEIFQEIIKKKTQTIKTPMDVSSLAALAVVTLAGGSG